MRCRGKSASFCDASTSLLDTAACLVYANKDASFLANKNGISPFYLAVACDISLVNSMLGLPGNDIQGRTPLASRLEGKRSLVHVALKAKNSAILDLILNEDPSFVNERDEEGRTCLSVGASIGFHEGICKILDRSLSSVYECDDDGSFPIHRAAEAGHKDIIEELLKRCPDSECLLNKQGQNMLHFAAKSGKCRHFLSVYMKKLDRKKIHLIEEQDVNGNTPLHLATINWHPRTVRELTKRVPFKKTKMLIIQNKDGLRALDVAELNLQSNYVLRERLTLTILMCVYAPRSVGWLSTNGMTLRSRSDHLVTTRYTDHINALLVIATLIATVTFAAGFTIPGGFSSSGPDLGQAILAKNTGLSVFLLFDSLAMQCSMLAIVGLIWALVGDYDMVHKALRFALVFLFVSLCAMSVAFFYGLLTAIKSNSTLMLALLAQFAIFYNAVAFLFFPFVCPQIPGIGGLGWTYFGLEILLLCVKEGGDDNGSGRMCVKRLECVGYSSDHHHLQNLEKERSSGVSRSIYLT